MLAEDETTKANLEATRLAITEIEVQLQQQMDIVIESTQHLPNQQNSDIAKNQSSAVDDTTLQQFLEPMTAMASATGMKFLVPDAFLEFCGNMID